MEGERLSSSLFSNDDPPLPTGADRCGNRPYHVQKVLRTIPVAADNRQKKHDWAALIPGTHTLLFSKHSLKRRNIGQGRAGSNEEGRHCLGVEEIPYG